MLKYTLARVGLFVAVAAILIALPIHISVLLKLMIAVIVSALLALVLLRGMRAPPWPARTARTQPATRTAGTPPVTRAARTRTLRRAPGRPVTGSVDYGSAHGGSDAQHRRHDLIGQAAVGALRRRDRLGDLGG
jgi:hypothetical protein